MNRLGLPLAVDLCEYQFTHYGFFGRTMNVVHHLPPPHLVGCLEVFINSLSLGKLCCWAVLHRAVRTTFHAGTFWGGELHRSVFANGLLFGKFYTGNEIAVVLSVCTSELFVNGLFHFPSFYYAFPYIHRRGHFFRHSSQFKPILFDSSSIANMNLFSDVNVVCDGSPSRIRMVLLISFGITTRPRSSIRLTIPVAFIKASNGKIVWFTPIIGDSAYFYPSFYQEKASFLTLSLKKRRKKWKIEMLWL